MSDKYSQRVLKHYKVQNDVLFDLMKIITIYDPSYGWTFVILDSQGIEIYEGFYYNDLHSCMEAATKQADSITA